MATMGEIRRDKGTGEEPVWIVSQKRWRARYVDASGKRRSVSSAIAGKPGKRICAKRRDEKLDAVRQGLDVGEATQKMSAYLDRWLRSKRRQLRPRSIEKYEGIIRLHLVPHIGAVEIGRLRHGRVTALYDDLSAAGVSDASLRYVHAVLHSALEDAIPNVIARNPADRAGVGKGKALEIQPFTPAEVRVLLDGIAGDRLEVLIILALRTAMRLGELLGLHWSDMDAGTSMLTVQRERYRHKGRWLTDAPKSGHMRAVRVDADTIEMLRAYRIERSEALLAIGHRIHDSDPVFLTDSAEPFDGHHLTERQFQPLLRRIGLPRRRFHDLRHTAATLMLGAGVHPKVVSEMLGHSDVQITLNRYSHVTPTIQAEAAAALEALTVRAAR